MYPPIEPYDSGMLNVGEGNSIYWEVCGNPSGQAAVVLHGGPGSGCNLGMRRLFDPARYRVVLFDQRGGGRSVPSAAKFSTDLSVNTTAHLIADLELLREHLSIEQWVVFGGSWGVTLGLAYAQRYPERVRAMVFSGITSTRRCEIDWLYRGVAPLFPEQWARFKAGVPPEMADGDLLEAYYMLLQDADESVRVKAARDWCEWEASLISVLPEYKPSPKWAEPEFQMTFARIVTHYFRHNAWLEDGVLLRDAYKLRNIPGVLIHGRMDLDAPLMTAWELANAWPGSELVVVHGAGHSGADPGMTEAVVAALDRFAGS